MAKNQEPADRQSEGGCNGDFEALPADFRRTAGGARKGRGQTTDSGRSELKPAWAAKKAKLEAHAGIDAARKF
jgi:hypothetical protein